MNTGSWLRKIFSLLFVALMVGAIAPRVFATITLPVLQLNCAATGMVATFDYNLNSAASFKLELVDTASSTVLDTQTTATLSGAGTATVTFAADFSAYDNLTVILYGMTNRGDWKEISRTSADNCLIEPTATETSVPPTDTPTDVPTATATNTLEPVSSIGDIGLDCKSVQFSISGPIVGTTGDVIIEVFNQNDSQNAVATLEYDSVTIPAQVPDAIVDGSIDPALASGSYYVEVNVNNNSDAAAAKSEVISVVGCEPTSTAVPYNNPVLTDMDADCSGMVTLYFDSSTVVGDSQLDHVGVLVTGYPGIVPLPGGAGYLTSHQSSITFHLDMSRWSEFDHVVVEARIRDEGLGMFRTLECPATINPTSTEVPATATATTVPAQPTEAPATVEPTAPAKVLPDTGTGSSQAAKDYRNLIISLLVMALILIASVIGRQRISNK